MEIHKGRLIDHVHLQVADIVASKAFYRAVLASLGKSISVEAEHFFIADELFVSQSVDDHSRVHIAFQAADHDEVKAFHHAAITSGGVDNGQPGERAYHPGYFAAFALDPDGNNIEAVYHGPAERSAESVVFSTPE
ncbi:VOC family protein [Yoonia maritima]|uniref:VOC family protein n=1 Tax=Yoonia maritima TaxID=1435347 RepID=UPI003734F13D